MDSEGYLDVCGSESIISQFFVIASFEHMAEAQEFGRSYYFGICPIRGTNPPVEYIPVGSGY